MTNSLRTWKWMNMAHLWLIYPLNMVIFHGFLYVYQAGYTL
jgi:hypothetical protein